MGFANKVVLLSGAGSGIGEATAIAFAKTSAILSIFDKNETVHAVGETCKKYNNKIITSTTDVTSDEDLKGLVEKTVEEFGRIDVLVNCAGSYYSGKITDEHFMDTNERCMKVNFRSAVLLTHLTVPHLIKTKGNIVNVTSVSSKLITPGWLPYDVSKAALSRFTACAALDLAADHVRINAVQPGGTQTNLLVNSGYFKADDNHKVWKNFAKKTPLGRIIHPEEVADLILYLASEKARSITGEEFAIDAGLLAKGYVPQK
ncbi:3-oxoacyl-[acyl-carrier-protein] reductase FabG-like [Aricia agestis]|uniref:3-oxoacyl-[acyl-carrier-protein] reductase FabG-like n=1 Tax=Aricia agestis TaxID=91739 RepID=UPI001C20772D|nr:3-oxoacyl-[acyl-carrier-protein] reductase FabG-like [Aricia agestis]